jgi:hypothetical protein
VRLQREHRPLGLEVFCDQTYEGVPPKQAGHAIYGGERSFLVKDYRSSIAQSGLRFEQGCEVRHRFVRRGPLFDDA